MKEGHTGRARRAVLLEQAVKTHRTAHPPRAVGYIRVSTEEQATDGISLEAQRTKIEAWCRLNDFELLEAKGLGILEFNGLTG